MTNFYETERQKFSGLASHWWDPNGKCRPLHELNPTRLQFISDRCILGDKKVLDIGCGGGILSESMAKRGAIVTGIDISADVLAVAKMHAEKEGLSLSQLNYEESTAESFSEKHAGSFDVVTCLELLEHVPDPGSLIQACAKLVKPNGHLFFSTLNRTPKSYLFAVLGAEYVLSLLPRGTHQYENFIRPSELETWLNNANLQLEDLVGLSYNPFFRKATLNKDVSINYLAHAISN